MIKKIEFNGYLYAAYYYDNSNKCIKVEIINKEKFDILHNNGIKTIFKLEENFEDNIICPACQYIFYDSHEYTDDHKYMECPACGSIFSMKINTTTTYSTKIISDKPIEIKDVK